MKDARHNTLTAIAEALVKAGYTSLDAQAKALGLPRSTAWTVVACKHKLGRLSMNTTRRMLANHALPTEVRTVVEAYLGALHSKAVGRKSRRLGKV
jgi:hypothetical protein